MRILVTGSRDWCDTATVYFAISSTIMENGMPSDVTIVHGNASGADEIAASFAKMWSYKQDVHPANWKKHGRAAGPIRNLEMVATKPDVCLAFIKNNSKGATNCATLAEKAGVPVMYFRENDEAI